MISRAFWLKVLEAQNLGNSKNKTKQEDAQNMYVNQKEQTMEGG